MRNEFDRYSETYGKEMEKALPFCAKDHDFFTEAKARCLLRLAGQQGRKPAELDVLDLGCGTGITDRLLAGNFKSLTGLDVSLKVVEKARELVPGVRFEAFDGHHLPAADDTYDLAFAINVFHHVPPANRQALLVEMHRVVKKGGCAVVFEHNPFNPLTRRVVKSCAFDADSVLLPSSELRGRLRDAGFARVSSRYILFIPFRGWLFNVLDHRLGWLPLGAQYYALGVKQ